MSSSKRTVWIIDNRETVLEKIARAVSTYSMLAFCIWISQGSTWWTFITGIFFFIVFFGQIFRLITDRKNLFYNKAEVLEWANKLEEWE